MIAVQGRLAGAHLAGRRSAWQKRGDADGCTGLILFDPTIRGDGLAP
ncbi:MAG TPA: hypothetical protein VD840_03045 [Sinorhizobium sp.]|nr:hypothetical protein [Sinorhizobium sp.]